MYKHFLSEQMSSDTRHPWQLRLEQAFKAVPSYKGSMFAALAHFVAWTQAEEYYVEDGQLHTTGYYAMPVAEYMEATAEWTSVGSLNTLNVQAALTMYLDEKPEVVTQWLNEYLREYNDQQARVKAQAAYDKKQARLAVKAAKVKGGA